MTDRRFNGIVRCSLSIVARRKWDACCATTNGTSPASKCTTSSSIELYCAQCRKETRSPTTPSLSTIRSSTLDEE